MTRVQDYLGDLRGAHARKTLLALVNGVRLLCAWYEVHGHPWLPTTADALRSFIAHIGDQPFRRRNSAGKICETGPVAAASLRQYLWAVGVLHRAAELPCPTKAGRVALVTDAFGRVHRVKQKQALPLTPLILSNDQRCQRSALSKGGVAPSVWEATTFGPIRGRMRNMPSAGLTPSLA
jgi:hypothetical protein